MVNPGKGGKNPFWSAVRRVDMAGENNAAWWNATMSAGVHEFPSAGVEPVVVIAAGCSVVVRPCSASMWNLAVFSGFRQGPFFRIYSGVPIPSIPAQIPVPIPAIPGTGIGVPELPE